jgi:ferredoxin
MAYYLEADTLFCIMARRKRHDFLVQATNSQQLYRVCKDCNKRTPHVCIKCGFCYSCHWKIEEEEEGTELNQSQLVVAATTTTI